MARRKKSPDAKVLFFLIVAALGLIAAILKGIWELFEIIRATFNKSKGTAAFIKDDNQSIDLSAQSSIPVKKTVSQRRYVENDNPVNITPSEHSLSSNFRIPDAPKIFGNTIWIPLGQSIEITGITISGGMIYVGKSLKTPYGENDPCLIDPSKPVSQHGDYTERQMSYWPSYSEISSSSRRAYLNWLADGRRDPEADIGYVFLFFYGLERRAIIDAINTPNTQTDWPDIAQETRRLLSIYGEKSNSFRRYACELLNWVSLVKLPSKLYEIPAPEFPRTLDLSPYIRLALGQTAVEGVPVPAHLALSWVKLDPNINMRTPAKRCAEQFDELFRQKYTEIFDAGMVLPRNRTKLKIVYRAASAGFRGYNEIKLTFGETPDVTVLTAPLKKLQLIVDAITKELEPYSRYIGKNSESKITLEGALLLPMSLWPNNTQQALQSLKSRVGSGMVMITFQDMLSTLDAKSTLTKDKTLTLVRALESINVGIEPDVLSGTKLPKPEDKVVLFSMPPGETVTRSTPAYQAALLTLQLASAVAGVDGEFSVKEINHLREQVQSWAHLTPNHLRRLLAQLRLLIAAPISLTSLKKKLEPLDISARLTIAKFMATVAQSDGTVSPTEVKMLEKVYKVLGVEPKKVFSDLHAVASTAYSTAAIADNAETGIRLDPARIAALQQDTEKVSALLSSIFKEDEPVATSVAESDDAETDQAAESKGILGLDEFHTALARMLLSRPQWSREELLDVAADLDLMLDGAIEHINEASFDTYSIPFTEGDDPIEINTEILEKIEA